MTDFFIRGRAVVQLIHVFPVGSCISLNFATDAGSPYFDYVPS